MSEPRFAIYYAPSETSQLWKAASCWLGRDAATCEQMIPPIIAGLSPEKQQEITQSPRHYGFHATLKPPFRLKQGQTYLDLVQALTKFAARHEACALPPLQVSLLGTFIALTLAEPSTEVSRIAQAAVLELDTFRKSAGELEIRRRREGLTMRQQELLERLGYPYVLDEWKFHMTLASRLPEPIDSIDGFGLELLSHLRRVLEPGLREHHALDSICLYSQPTQISPFRLVKRFPLASMSSCPP